MLDMIEPSSIPLEEARWAEDIGGVWHERRDDYWDNSIQADVRAHCLCGRDIWSAHTSAFDPRQGNWSEPQRYCSDCSRLSSPTHQSKTPDDTT